MAVDGDVFVVETARAAHRARAVVMATGYNRVPNPDRPPGAERFQGQLLHAASYRNAEPFAGKNVLVVGAGNTGAEIALELAERGAKPTLAVRTPVNVVPRDFLGLPTQVTSIRMSRAPIALGDNLGRLISRLVFGNLARFGLARPELGPLSAIKLRRRIPLIDIGTIAAIKDGRISVKPAVDHFTPQGAAFADSSESEFQAIVLATGYGPGLAEVVDVPGVLAEDGIRATGGPAARAPTCSSSASGTWRPACYARSASRRRQWPRRLLALPDRPKVACGGMIGTWCGRCSSGRCLRRRRRGTSRQRGRRRGGRTYAGGAAPRAAHPGDPQLRLGGGLSHSGSTPVGSARSPWLPPRQAWRPSTLSISTAASISVSVAAACGSAAATSGACAFRCSGTSASRATWRACTPRSISGSSATR